MYDQSQRRSGRSNESAISRIMTAAGNAKLAKEKAKQEILKQAILSKMRSNQGMNDFKAKEDYKQQSKANDPSQTFLRNRMTQENPFDQMTLPETEDDSVEFPADKVGQTPQGKPVLKPMGQREQEAGFISQVEKRKAAGQKVSPYAEMLAQKMKLRQPKTAGYERPATEKINEATQKALAGLASMKTQQEALNEIDANEEAYQLSGVDTAYVKKRIAEVLPSEYQPGKKGILGFGKKPERKKKGGQWYEKKDNYWEPVNLQEDEKL